MKTPLYHHHLQAEGRIVDFAGWELPVQYSSGVVAEHMAVREAAGLFDVSHMGEFRIAGPHALAFLQALTTNDVAKLQPGRAHYSLLCNETGGIIDDIIIYCIAPEEYLMVVNAGNLETDWHWLLAHRVEGAQLTNESAQTALLALQGPHAERILAHLVNIDLTALKRFSHAEAALQCADTVVHVRVARTGYTGSPGFEIFAPGETVGAVWRTLLERGEPHGLIPCGLAARDTLRLEVGYPLHGHDISEKISPWESRLDWVVKMESGDFLGRAALAKQKANGVTRTLVGLRMVDPGIAREGCSIIHAGKPVGFVTSGTMSPMLRKGVALGMVPIALAHEGQKFAIDIRGKERQAEVVSLPFVEV